MPENPHEPPFIRPLGWTILSVAGVIALGWFGWQAYWLVLYVRAGGQH